MRPRILLMDTIAEKGVKTIEEFADLIDGRAYTLNQITNEIANYEGLVIKSNNWISTELLQRATHLKVIGRAGSGIDNIDMKTATERNIKIITSPEGNVCSVAEYVLCMMILLSHKLSDAHNGSKQNDFRRQLWQGQNLKNSTVGLIGMGNIGRGVAEKIAPLCKNVLAYDPYVKKNILLINNFELVSNLNTLLCSSDIISLHLPLTPETKNMINENTFSYIKKGAILINSSRGQIIDDYALLKAFRDGTIQSAALDALYPDPEFNVAPEESTYSHFLVHHPKVYYTPHIAAGSKNALEDVACTLAAKMKLFFLNGTC